MPQDPNDLPAVTNTAQAGEPASTLLERIRSEREGLVVVKPKRGRKLLV